MSELLQDCKIDLGRTYITAKYCQAIQDGNKVKRLDWCNKRMEEKEAFDDVIFTNESTVQAEEPCQTPCVTVGWGSKQGATQLVIFDGNMNATKCG